MNRYLIAISNPSLIVALVAALAGPLIAYVVANRRLSGKIGTSEASQLWEESAKIREEYRGRIARSDERTTALEERVAKLELRNNELARENSSLLTQVSSYEQIITDLRTRIDVLELANAKLEKRIAILLKEEPDASA